MQRISSWFEQLPLRRRSSQRRTESRHLQKQSKSAAPRLRYSVSAVQQHKFRDHSADGYANSLVKQDQQYGIGTIFLVLILIITIIFPKEKVKKKQ